jgi:hypothetical protein
VALTTDVLEIGLALPAPTAIEPAGLPRPRTAGVCNAVHPTLMTTRERLGEVADILAAGLMRLRARQSSALPADFGESSLDCAGEQSGHANVLKDGDLA